MTAATDTKIYDGTTSSAAVPTITVGSLAPGDVANFIESFDTRNAVQARRSRRRVPSLTAMAALTISIRS